MLDVTVLEALPQKLTGKVALVTGSARGLGRAYAIRLARLGADVVVNDVNLQANREYDEPLTPGCETVADEIRALDRRSMAIQADVTDETPGQGHGAGDRLHLGDGGHPGLQRRGRWWRNSLASEMAIADFKRMLDINLTGTILACQAVAPVMKARRRGKIVTVGSQAGLRSQGGGRHSYSVAKARSTTTPASWRPSWARTT